MNRKGISGVTLEPGESPPAGDTDWTRVENMAEEEVLAAALSDPDAQPLTPEQLAQMRHPVDVKALRTRLGMTQERFSAAFRIPLGTLRDWEQRRKMPDAPARAYLMVIERDPAAVEAALKAA